MEKVQIKSKIIILYFALLFCILIFAKTANAATLYFSPSSGSYEISKNFSVNVFVSSADQAINAASGVISFPKDTLEVISLSKSGSIFSLWVQEPSFSNNIGTVNFEGIVLNPGFTGATGKIITINFRAKANGTAFLNFPSGSVLANDGKGTDILTSLGNANFVLKEVTSPAPETPPLKVAETPSAPQISSPTHPNSDKWYAKKDAKFTWLVPADATGVRLLVSKIPMAIPAVTYVPVISEKEVTNLDDGVWYFHVRFRNASGWGEISHFRFQIDTEKPERFEIREIERKDLTEPKAKFIFDAKDETSGIDYYEIQIDSRITQIWRDDGSHSYETAVTEPGKHILIAKVVDQAGNFLLASSTEFIIEPLNPPIITEYLKELQSGERLVVNGLTYSTSKVIVWLQREKGEPWNQIIKSDNQGVFTLAITERLEDGIYKIWVEAVDQRGTKSEPSEKIIITVKPSMILKMKTQTAIFVAVIVSFAALIIALLALWFSWHKCFIFQTKKQKSVSNNRARKT